MTRILIVDDDAQVRRMLCQTLAREGYEVADAPDGEHALRLFREDPTDLVLLDIYMPEKEGLETILELREAHPGVRIVAMSGGGGLFGYEVLETAGHFGAMLTLTKPFNRETLLRTVGEALEQG